MSHDSAHTCSCGGSCGCSSGVEDARAYLTLDEYAARLEQYLEDLKAEIVSVEKELSRLRQKA